MPLVPIKNTLAPDLASKLKAVQNRSPLLSAMGQAVKALGVQAFTDASKRPTDWAPRKVEPKDGHAILQKSTMLRKSIRITSVTNDTVIIGSDRPYAAAHQFGVPERNLPARPYLPFYKDGQLTPEGNRRVTSALKAALASQGL